MSKNASINDNLTPTKLANQSNSEFAIHKPRAKIKYGVVIYDTFDLARRDQATIKKLTQDFGQLNVIIREEGFMNDPLILAISPNIKIFAGAAWTLIHERRLADGWYEETNEVPFPFPFPMVPP